MGTTSVAVMEIFFESVIPKALIKTMFKDRSQQLRDS